MKGNFRINIKYTAIPKKGKQQDVIPILKPTKKSNFRNNLEIAGWAAFTLGAIALLIFTYTLK